MEDVKRESGHLSSFTTLGIGGWCQDVYKVDSAQQIPELFQSLDEQRTHLLGGGSNVVISDDGVCDSVVALGSPYHNVLVNDAGIIDLDAALPWTSVAGELSARNIGGLESLVGIPGTVGGAIVQNVGAYGYELADRVISVLVYDRKLGKSRTLQNADCAFGYRTSAFKGSTQGQLVVLSAQLQLHPDGLHTPKYEELERRLVATSGHGMRGRYQPLDVMNAVLQLREQKSAVFHEGDPQTRSVGSFFVNPVATKDEFESVKRFSKKARVDAPHWILDDGSIKVSAGWLVEQSGFVRGFRDGRVGLSKNHALSIVNLNGCSSAELIKFAGSIRRAVGIKFGLWLRPEPIFVGFEIDELIENGLVESAIASDGVRS